MRQNKFGAIAFVAATVFATAPLFGAEENARGSSFDVPISTPDAPVAGRLRFDCIADPHGGPMLELRVPNAGGIAQFDFDAFEGPDAPASAIALSQLRVSGGRQDVGAKLTVGGWYAGDDGKAFILSINQTPQQEPELGRVLGALLTSDSTLDWKQLGYADRNVSISVHFRPDAAQRAQLASTLKACTGQR